MAKTKIDWTDKSWNPITGCTQISEGCKNCYAKTMAKRLHAMGAKGYEHEFKVTYHPERLLEPYSWKKPCKVFVCSMGDLFHSDVPIENIKAVFQVIRDNPQHTFQILTKRAWRIRDIVDEIGEWPKNAWLGVTVENDKEKLRIPMLISAAPIGVVKFVSFEPLLGDIDLTWLGGVFDYIDWAIVGGETGKNAREMSLDWARNIRDMCERKNIPFFFKQSGGKSGKGDKTLDGVSYREFPRA